MTVEGMMTQDLMKMVLLQLLQHNKVTIHAILHCKLSKAVPLMVAP